MKPLKLTMQAFGPFAGTEHLCFAELGENPLFLINGPTGSGKTTLLDAMCLALYNSTTGAERQGAEMRCNQAEPDVETFVEFEFELGEHSYRIRRSPEQLRPSKRTEKLVTQRPVASLHRLGKDGNEEAGGLLVASKVNEATEYIERLTGLTGDQFRQVMVLPQGEFRRLLLADSKDREDIFASLFHTGIFGKLEDALRSRAAGVRQNVQDRRNQLKGILSSAAVDSIEALDNAVGEYTELVANAAVKAAAAAAIWSSADKTLDAATALDHAFRRLDESKRTAATLEASAVDFSGKRVQLALAEMAESLRPLLNVRDVALTHKAQAASARDKAEERLAASENALQQGVAGLARTQTKKPVLEAAKSRRQELEAYRGNSNTLVAAIGRHEAAKKARELANAALGQAEIRDQTAGEDVAQLEAKGVQLRTESSALADFPVQVARLEPLLANRRQLGGVEAALVASREALEQTRSRSAAADKAQATARASYDALRLAWHRGQAAFLAEALEVGEPCAVCGSREHPIPAPAEELVEPEALERAEKDYQDAVSRAQSALAQLKSEQDRIAGFEQSLLEGRTSLGELAGRSISSLEQDLAALKVGIDRLETLNREHSGVLETLAARRSKLKEAAIAAESAGRVLQQADLALAAIGAEKALAESSLPEAFRTADALDAALDQMEIDIAAQEQEAENAQAEHNKAVTAVALESSGVERAKSDMLNQESEVRQATAQFDEALASSSFESEKARALAAMAMADKIRLAEAIAEYDTLCNNIKTTLAVLQEQLAGKERQDLESLAAGVSVALTEKKNLEEDWSALSKELHTLEQVKLSFERESAAMETLEAEYAVIGTLSDVANGQTGNKVSLQRFILGVLLDEVLVQASQRLMRMSSGRYQLIRKDEKSKGNKASGLDLMVYDDHSGTERSVATLSGGESFMAALSLALGLSEIVQSHAGGTRLDTLFVDEGFGSLDQDSLELAIRTLIDLQESGRMVGVISHVSELKEQMALRIDVEKGVNGSHLSIVGHSLA